MAVKEHWGEIPIPEGVNVTVDENIVKIKGPLGEITKDFSKIPVEFYVEDNKVIKFKIFLKGKRGFALINTIRSKLNNLFIGVQKGYVYKMKVYHVHFPISIEISGDEVIIKNFIGERGARRAKIMPGVNVKVEKR